SVPDIATHLAVVAVGGGPEQSLGIRALAGPGNIRLTHVAHRARVTALPPQPGDELIHRPVLAGLPQPRVHRPAVAPEVLAHAHGPGDVLGIDRALILPRTDLPRGDAEQVNPQRKPGAVGTQLRARAN